MICPFCQFKDTKVIDSRIIANGAQIKRRRECLECKLRFTSIEMADLDLPKVIKRNGVVEKFNEDKLRTSIKVALHKRDFKYEDLTVAIYKINESLFKMGKKEVLSQVIGDLVIEQLKKIDHVAYVRFASVYKSFKQIDDFSKEVESLKKQD